MTNKPALRTLPWLLSCLAALLLGSRSHAKPYEELMVQRQLHWVHEGSEYTVEVGVPLVHYLHYQRKLRYYQNYAWYTGEHKDYQMVGEIALSLDSLAASLGLDERGRMEFIIGFVQSIEYQKDPPTEYPKFPAETLADAAGDCEDTSILLAALLHRLGYPVVLLSPPGHMAVGVGCPSCLGPGIEYRGSTYHYVETTAEGYGIGEVPDLFQGQPLTVIPLTLSADELALLNDEGPLYQVVAEPAIYCYDSGEKQIRSQMLSKWMVMSANRSQDFERQRSLRMKPD